LSSYGILVVTFCLVGHGFAGQKGAASVKPARPEYVPGEILVKFKPDAVRLPKDKAAASLDKISVRSKALEKLNKKFGATRMERVFKTPSEKKRTRLLQTGRVDPFRNLYHIYKLKLPKEVDITSTVKEYEKNPDVEYAEPNYYKHLDSVPNDPDFSNQWGLQNINDSDIDAPEAWDVQTGNSDIIIAVIDDGVDLDHEDLAANIWTNQGEIAGNGIDDDENGYIDDINGWDTSNDDNDPNPDGSDDHGTHIAGIIGAVGNNGVGVVGVNWNSKIMALKFSGSIADEVLAIQYAIDNGAKVINASFGDDDFSQTEKEAIIAADSAGVLFVAAAGNDGDNNDIVDCYPSNCDVPNIIAVAATDQNDNLCDWSNYGATKVDLAAPGLRIYSTIPDNSYGYKDGTSMATPYVAGVAGLIWAQYSSWTNTQVKTQILNTVDTLPDLAGKMVTGGRLNAARALGIVSPNPPTNLTATLSGSNNILLTWQDPTTNDDGTLLTNLSNINIYRNGSLVTTVAPGVQTYSDSNLDVGPYVYHLQAVNTNGYESYPSSCTERIIVGDSILFDFENNEGGFQPNGAWEWGTPSSGPNIAYSGTKTWATNLSGNYSDYANGFLDSPLIDLGSGTSPWLSFYHWYEIESDYDGGNVKISTDGGQTFNLITPEGGYPDPDGIDVMPSEGVFTGRSGTYTSANFDISTYAGQQVVFRFHFASDDSVVYPGWYIDDIAIISDSLPPVVTGISPDSGTNNTTITTTIWGKHFQVGAQVELVDGTSTILGTNTTVNPDIGTITTIFDLAGAQTGFWDVVVANPDGLSGTLTSGFTVVAPPPVIISINPNKASNNTSTNVTITGNYFMDTPTVRLNNALFFDDGENGPSKWSLSGFNLSAARSHSPGNSFYSNQGNNLSNSMKTVNPISIPGDSSTLFFWCYYNTESGYDKAYLDVSTNGTSWTTLDTYKGSQLSWTRKDYDLSSYAGEDIYLKFRYTTNGSVVKEGFYVDDITIGDTIETNVMYSSPTSLTATVPSGITSATYDVVVTNPDGQSGTLEDGFTVVCSLTVAADFSGTSTTGCAPLTVDFSDSSTGNVLSWLWNFGDGDTDTVQNPTYIYTNPGTYTVSLIVSDTCGSDTEIKIGYIVVGNTPTANFTVDNQTPCSGTAVQFTSNCTGTVDTYSWDFGDGGTSTDTNPIHIYTTTNACTVTLTIIGPCGTDTESKTSHINPASSPKAVFMSNPLIGCAPLDVCFTDSSIGTILSYLWDFGDGETSTDSSPTYIYTQSGLYTVVLTVTGQCGSDTESSFIIVGEYVSDTSGGVAKSEDGKVRIDFDAGDLGTDGWIVINQDPEDTTGTMPGSYYQLGQTTVELIAYDSGGNPITDFAGDVLLVLYYLDEDQDGIVDNTDPPINESALKVYKLENGNWVEASGSVVYENENNVQARLSSFSIYTLMGKSALAPSLGQVLVYPNPFKKYKHNRINFGHPTDTDRRLPQEATIKIYTITGELVKKIEVTEADDGYVTWDGTNQNDKPLASGIYIYHISSPNSNKPIIGRIGIVK